MVHKLAPPKYKVEALYLACFTSHKLQGCLSGYRSKKGCMGQHTMYNRVPALCCWSAQGQDILFQLRKPLAQSLLPKAPRTNMRHTQKGMRGGIGT